MFLILIGSDVVLLNILRSEDVFHGFRGSHVVLPKKIGQMLCCLKFLDQILGSKLVKVRGAAQNQKM